MTKNHLRVLSGQAARVPTAYYLICIIILSFCVRTFVWHFSNWVGMVWHGDGYLYMAQAMAAGEWGKYFSHWRFLQPVYPLYLAPMFYFNLDYGTYVFWLHQSLAAATIIFLYAAVAKIYGRGCSLVAALVYAVQLQIAYWINWTLADVTFHFHLALFMWFVLDIWKEAHLRSAGLAAAAGLLLMLTRPDGFVIVSSAAAVLMFKALNRKFKPVHSLILVVLTFSLALAAALGVIFSDEKISERVLSNIHVGWGLYTGTLPTPTNPAAVDQPMIAMFRDGSLLSQKDPKGRNQWYWASQMGLQRIKEAPFKVARIMVTRYVAVIIPSTFRDHVSWRFALIDRTFSFYLIIGTLCALLIRNDKRFYTAGLACAAFSVYTLVCVYQREWDIRVQLSTYALLLGAATYGWSLALERLRMQIGLKREPVL
jgi:hypothetical protein